MTTREFAKAFYAEKEELLGEYFDPGTESEVGTLIRGLGLDARKAAVLRRIIDGVLSDALYTVLLGLDGAGSIGGVQARYTVQDEDGNLLTGGDLEGAAWEVFYGGDGG